MTACLLIEGGEGGEGSEGAVEGALKGTRRNRRSKEIRRPFDPSSFDSFERRLRPLRPFAILRFLRLRRQANAQLDGEDEPALFGEDLELFDVVEHIGAALLLEEVTHVHVDAIAIETDAARQRSR